MAVAIYSRVGVSAFSVNVVETTAGEGDTLTIERNDPPDFTTETLSATVDGIATAVAPAAVDASTATLIIPAGVSEGLGRTVEFTAGAFVATDSVEIVGLAPETTTAIAAVEGTGASLTGAQKTAADEFIAPLVASGVWAKIAGLYMFLGGTEAAHSVNWRSPGTNDIVWTGLLTHDANGVTSDGGYGDTGLVLANANATDNGMAVYVRTLSPGGNTYGGALVNGRGVYISNINFGDAILMPNFSTNNLIIDFGPGTRTGALLNTRTLSNQFIRGRNGVNSVVFDNATPAADGSPTYHVLARGIIGGQEQIATSCNIALICFLANGLTEAESIDFTNAMQTLQIALGRAV